MPGRGGAQLLLGAVRVGRAGGQDPVVSSQDLMVASDAAVASHERLIRRNGREVEWTSVLLEVSVLEGRPTSLRGQLPRSCWSCG